MARLTNVANVGDHPFFTWVVLAQERKGATRYSKQDLDRLQDADQTNLDIVKVLVKESNRR